MELVRLSDAQLAFGTAPILNKVNVQINEGERVCIVGRNGAGKSSLLKVISGDLGLDDGKIQFVNEVTVARLEQDPPRGQQGTVYDFVSAGVSHVIELVTEFNDLSMKVAESPNLMSRMEKVQIQIDQLDGWSVDSRISQT